MWSLKYNREFYYLFCYSCVEYHEKAGLLYVGGCGQEEEGMSTATKEGLTAWRILSDYPHFKLVTDYAEDLGRVSSLFSYFTSFKNARYHVYYIVKGQMLCQVSHLLFHNYVFYQWIAI